MAFVCGTTNSDILNAADGVTTSGDHVYGGDGHDTICGLGGNDNLVGEDGRDKLYGSIGNDWLEGGKNHDDLFGGDNDDVLFGGAGDDELYGEHDYDRGGAGADRLDGDDGIDWASTTTRTTACVSRSILPDDRRESSVDAEGDILADIEYLVGSGKATSSRERSSQPGERHGRQRRAGGDGGDGADTLEGNGGEDWLEGGGESDTLRGGAASDTLNGGDGDDTLEGNSGDDELDGGDDADSMWGGTGNDIYIVDDAADVVTEYAGGGTDTVDASISYTLSAEVENLALIGVGGLNGTGNDRDNAIWGSNYDNLLNGGGGVDTIKGAGGADIIDGGTGADTMLGGDGGDIFIVDDAGDVVTEAIGEGFDMLQTTVSYSLAAGSEVEVLYADPATTTATISLTGNEFDNFLTGNDGINVLVGGLGIDILRGNGGGDAFLWSSVAEVGSSNPDIVTDYSSAQGDVLHFTGIDADETLADDQNFTFRGTEAFTAAGQINWFTNGTDTFLQFNTNADLNAEGIIQLNGVINGDAVLMFL